MSILSQPLKRGEDAADSYGMSDDERAADPARDRGAGEELSFAAFVLTHTGCRDPTVEVRLDEGLLIEWCPTCAALEAFGAP